MIILRMMTLEGIAALIVEEAEAYAEIRARRSGGASRHRRSGPDHPPTRSGSTGDARAFRIV